MTTIQKKRVAKLIAALRSGKYRQARQRLRENDKFCCLGVACEVYRKTTGEGKWDGGRFLGHRSDLPSRVAEWYGFDDTDPVIVPRARESRGTATARNDDACEPFATIADRFEKVFLG